MTGATTQAATSAWLWRRKEWLLLSGWLGANAGGWMLDWALKAGVAGGMAAGAAWLAACWLLWSGVRHRVVRGD